MKLGQGLVCSLHRRKRLPMDTSRLPSDEAEQFLPVPIRCRGCHTMIWVVSCRACSVRREAVSLPNAPLLNGFFPGNVNLTARLLTHPGGHG